MDDGGGALRCCVLVLACVKCGGSFWTLTCAGIVELRLDVVEASRVVWPCVTCRSLDRSVTHRPVSWWSSIWNLEMYTDCNVQSSRLQST